MSRQFTRDIQREVSAGRDGQSQRFGFAGRNYNIPVGIETQLWDLGGTYTYSTTATQYYVSSTDPTDNAFIICLGIDNEIDGRLVIRLTQLDGQNKVPLDGLMYRIFVHGAFGPGKFDGNIYVYEDDTVIGGVPQTFSKIRSYSQNREDGVNGTYTIPFNATAYFDNFKILKGALKNFNLNLKVKLLGMNYFGNLPFPANPQVLEWSPRFTGSAGDDVEFTATAKDNRSFLILLIEGVLEFE